MIRRTFVTVAGTLGMLAVTLISSTARAQELSRPQHDSLSTVVVTATKVPIVTAAPTSSTTVLNGDELRAQGMTRVVDALRLVPGTDVVQSGPVGSLTSVFMRGGNSNYVRVMVDGVTMNEDGGAFDWASLTLDNVDRIEVVRGPASVLYGSDAVTGTVQIFTKQGTGPASVHAYTGVGSRGGRRDELGVSSGDSKAGFTLSGEHQYTDGILPFNNGFLDDVMSGSLRLTPDRATDIHLSGRWSSQIYHYPTDYTGAVVDHNSETTDHRLVLSLDAGHKLSDRTELRLALASNEYLPRSNDGPDSPADTLGYYGSYSRSTEVRHSADLRLNSRYGSSGMFTIGSEISTDREDQSTLSLSQYGNTPGSFSASRHNTAGYAQAIGNANDRLSYVVGGRLDENSEFGQFETMRAGLAYVLSAAARVRASVGSAFTEPSFYENFATGYVTGNPNLHPEHSRSAEVGTDLFLAGGALTLKATGFFQQFHDIIDYSAATPFAGAPNYFNIAAANANGLELEADYRAAHSVTLAGNYTYTATRTTQQGFDSTTGASYVPGQPLIRRPANMWSVSALQAYANGTQLWLIASYVGQRADRDFVPYPAVPVTLPGYTKVDLSVDIPLPIHARGGTWLQARVDNVFNAQYQEIVRFPAPGRMVFVGIAIGR